MPTFASNIWILNLIHAYHSALVCHARETVCADDLILIDAGDSWKCVHIHMIIYGVIFEYKIGRNGCDV